MNQRPIRDRGKTAIRGRGGGEMLGVERDLNDDQDREGRVFLLDGHLFLASIVRLRGRRDTNSV